MPEHIRALVVILVLTTPVWWIAKDAFSGLLPSSTFSRWRNLWFVVTLALFLSHNYWIFAFVLTSIVLAVRRQETQVVGLYFALLLSGSSVLTQVPGFGIVNYILEIDHYRLLNIALLLPAAVALMRSRERLGWGKIRVDFLILAYLFINTVLEFRTPSFTHALRGIVSLGVDVLLPYYVCSRTVRNLDEFKIALSGLVIAAGLLVPIALFEASRGWLLYTGVAAPLGLNTSAWSQYLGRAGFLRATASAGHPIVLGFVFMVALGFFVFIGHGIRKEWQRSLALGGLILGLLSTFSRGPWVGAVLVGIGFLVATGKPLRNFPVIALAIILLIAFLGAFPAGNRLLDLLPFFGAEEAGTVDYRLELWSFVQPVVERNLLLGSDDFRESPELQTLAAIQGQGIPDLVNSYFTILLSSGVIGLSLFLLTFLRALQLTFQGFRSSFLNNEHKVLGVSLFFSLLASLITIATVSSITAIPAILWSMLGLCVAYAKMVSGFAKRSSVPSIMFGSEPVSERR